MLRIAIRVRCRSPHGSAEFAPERDRQAGRQPRLPAQSSLALVDRQDALLQLQDGQVDGGGEDRADVAAGPGRRCSCPGCR